VPKEKKTEAGAPPLDAYPIGKRPIKRRGEVDRRNATITKRGESDRWNGETSKTANSWEWTQNILR
jgi:hypothetical protein